jgi:CHASE2 domain-containing sensor protein
LISADIEDADFSKSTVGWTVFSNSDLSEAKGLETVEHHGPSTIGIDIVQNWQGKIPKIFLQGAGVSEAFIQHLPLLTASADQFHSCFISYSSKDQEFAERLHADL